MFISISTGRKGIPYAGKIHSKMSYLQQIGSIAAAIYFITSTHLSFVVRPGTPYRLLREEVMLLSYDSFIQALNVVDRRGLDDGWGLLD